MRPLLMILAWSSPAHHREAIAAIVAHPGVFVEGITPTILQLPAPAIAPPGGAFLLTWVAVAGTLQQVDWYWPPAATARRPAARRLLFARRPFASSPPPAPLTAAARERLVDELIRDALLMIMNGRKHILRHDPWGALAHLRQLATCLAQLEWVLMQGTAPDVATGPLPRLPARPPTTPSAQLALLQTDAQRLMMGIAQASRDAVFHDAVRAIATALARAEDALAASRHRA